MESHQKQKDRDELQKEILSSLFNGYEHCEEAPTKTVKDVNKSSRYGHAVFEPPKDEDYKIDMNFSRRDNIDGTSVGLILSLCFPFVILENLVLNYLVVKTSFIELRDFCDCSWHFNKILSRVLIIFGMCMILILW